MTLAAFIVYFTVANLWSGGKFKRWVGDWWGRSHYYSSLATIILGWWLFDEPGLLIGISFALWRAPGWYGSIDSGTNEGGVARDFWVMSLRGLLAFPFFLWVLYEAHSDKLSALYLYPLGALALACLGQGAAYYIGNRVYPVGLRAWVCEGLAGSVWGVAYGLTLAWAGTT